MKYPIDQIADLAKGQFINAEIKRHSISNVIYDTRKISYPNDSIFTALKGQLNNGHDFIPLAYQKGIRNFLVDEDISIEKFPEANFILVEDVLKSLQELAEKHRKLFSYPVIAITGSNGKTIVKEWLGQALSQKHKTIKSPLSFNSQLGVALSVLQMENDHEYGVFEAGISQVNEMEKLSKMLLPDVGILTNIGDAHSSGFKNEEEKLKEKLKLFSSCKTLVFNGEDKQLCSWIEKHYKNDTLSWGENEQADIRIQRTKEPNKSRAIVSQFVISYKEKKYELKLPYFNKHLIENCFQVISTLIYLDWGNLEIQKAIDQFSPLENRLELKAGLNNSLLINDSYSSDLSSMKLALEYLDQHSQNKNKIVIFSDLDQQREKSNTFKAFNKLFKEKNLSQIYSIGLSQADQKLFDDSAIHFSNTEAFNLNFDTRTIRDSSILIKGARKFKLEKLFNKLSQQAHQTTLETDFAALDHNLNYYKSSLQKETKIMAVVKAEAYGTGSVQLANHLSKNKVDYLAVALVDEAIKIRMASCHLPIMVFNVHDQNTDQLFEYDLEPEIYSFEVLNSIIISSEKFKKKINVHLKVDSGMHRLGFEYNELESLSKKLNDSKYINVASIFSHLSASDNSQFDDFSRSQFESYERSYETICSKISSRPHRHILNTAGIIRFPEYQYEMVRLGLGLYGIDETQSISKKLERVHTLKSTVIQIKDLNKGESTGYNRSGMTSIDRKIAIVNIGYADGLMRLTGNGNYKPVVNGISCPTIGNICMDVCMIDITGHSDIKVGDEVLFFGKDLPIESLAKSCKTISYEVLSRIAPRIKRVYIYN